MWDTIAKIFDIITSTTKFLSKLFNRTKTHKQIESDKQLADNIKKGNEQKIAEEWKRRKYYNENK